MQYRLWFKGVWLFVIGFLTIISETFLYTHFNFFVTTQLTIPIIFIFVCMLAVIDVDDSNVSRNSVIVVLLGIIYGISFNMSSVFYAIILYFVYNIFNKYIKTFEIYFIYFFVSVMYFLYYLNRIFYFIIIENIYTNFFDLSIKNLIIPTFINSLIFLVVYIVCKRKVETNKKKNRGYQYKY